MHSLRTTLGALLFATFLGCPGGGGGAGGGGGLASPEEVGAAFQAAVQAGDWGTCYDLVVPAERETMVIKRLGRVVRAAQRAKEASKPLYVAFLDDLGIDPDATPGAEGDSLAKRQALALEAYKSGIDGDYRGTWVELLQLLEQQLVLGVEPDPAILHQRLQRLDP